MPRSKYFELLEELNTLTRGGVGKFGSVDELGEMLRKRATFVHQAEAALKAGEVTQDEYDKLIQLNRKHALPLGG
jgi:hypothetical protein